MTFKKMFENFSLERSLFKKTNTEDLLRKKNIFPNNLFKQCGAVIKCSLSYGLEKIFLSLFIVRYSYKTLPSWVQNSQPSLNIFVATQQRMQIVFVYDFLKRKCFGEKLVLDIYQIRPGSCEMP